MKIPNSIAQKLTKLILAITSITVLGLILSFVMNDYTLLLLTIGIAVSGAIKCLDYFRTVKEGRYDCLKGQLLDEHASLGRKRHSIILLLEDGTQVQRIIQGRYKLKKGDYYCFYLKRDDHSLCFDQLPESLQPASIVLGLEECSLSSGKQI